MYTKIQESEIASCDYGIVDYYSSDNSWIRDCKIQNIEYTGVDLRDGVNALLYGNTIQNCKRDGIYMDNIYQVSMNEGYVDINPDPNIDERNPNIIRYNGSEDATLYRGINASDCYFYRLTKTHVYENLGTGIVLKNQASVNNSASYTYDLILANNALELGINIFTPNVFNSQVRVGNGCTWDISFKNHDFMDRYSSSSTPLDATFFITYSDGGSHDISGNYYRNDDYVFVPADLPTSEYYFFENPPFVDLVCTDMATEATNDESDYWQILDFDDSPQGMLDLAYSLMDSVEARAEAEEILDELIEQRYIPALRALCCLKRMIGDEAGEVAAYLDVLPRDTVDTAFNLEIEFAKASSYLAYAEFSSARNTYDGILEEELNVPDSIRAELGIAESDLLELAYAEMEDGGLHTQGSGNSLSRRIAVEDRIGELRGALYNFYNGIEGENERPLPTKFALEAAYPNPFNPSVTVPYALPKTADVKLTVYNVLGQRVTRLVNRKMDAGYHRVVWNGRSQTGLPVASGVYFVTMEAENYVKTQKLVLMK